MEKEKFNWKRLLITTGFVFLTASAVGGTTWYLMDKQAREDADAQEKTIEELQEKLKNDKVIGETILKADPTINWKTYSNSTLGYSYKYPTTLTFYEGRGISNNNLVLDEGNSININAIRNTFSKTPEAYFSEVTHRISVNPTSGATFFEGGKNKKVVTIGENKAVVFDYTLPGGQVWKVYLLTDNKTVVEVTVVGDANLIKTAESIIATLVLQHK